MDSLLAELRAVAEPTRLRLLVLCAASDLSVSELTQILGQSQPRVSRHLKLLCDAGLLQRTREGTNAFFRLPPVGDAARLARTLIDQIPADDPVVASDRRRLNTVRTARADAAAHYFRRNAAEWDRIRSLHVDERVVEQALVDLLPDGGARRLLDVGTGTGRMLQVFAPLVDYAVGVDTSREMLAVARANLDATGLRNCALRQGDMYQLPWDGDAFDGAVLHMVLHYADAPADAIAEAARVLRRGGRLLLVDFAPHALEELRAEHAHRHLGFADGEVAAWYRAAGLVLIEERALAGEPLTVSIWVGEQRAARPRPSISAPAGQVA